MNRFRRAVNATLFLAIALGCLIVLQKSFHFINKGPLLNVDDSIPNVAVALAEHGRYGFLSSPTQGLHEVDRTHAFFNYGPLYFYLAAALTWLMGPSLVMYRMMHPLGLVGIVLVLLFALKRFSLVGPALFAVAIFYIYLQSHWPMARPDIMVSVCVALMLIFARHAIEQGDQLSWFAAGFFACSAVTTHQIAAVMVPVIGLIWLWSVAAEWRDRTAEFRRHARTSFLAVVLGGGAGALLYLAAIDFRVRDLWDLGHAGMTLYSRPYLEVLNSHLYYAWSSLNRTSFLFLKIGFCGAALLSLVGYFLPALWRRRVLAYVMPPVLVSGCYQLSLGFYGNNHSGYVILSQVATIWAVASLVSLTIRWICDRFGPRGHHLEVVALVAAVLAVARADVAWARWPSTWESISVGNADINDYIREVESPLPEGAAVWGSLFFGLDAGDRTDLVQFFQMYRVVQDFRADRRSNVAPDYLVLSSYELDTDFVRCVGGADSYIENFTKLFPGVRYLPVHLVYAPPYGVTREYQRVLDQEDVKPEPGVAVNDGASRQWSTQLSPPLAVTFSPTSSVTVNVAEYSIKTERQALRSLMTNLPAGFFLIEVAIDRRDSGPVGFLTATPGRYFYWHGGWTNFSVPTAPYLPGDQDAFLLVDHLGGPLYVSRFEYAAALQASPPRRDLTKTASSLAKSRRDVMTVTKGDQPYGLTVVSVRRVSVLADESGRIQPLSVPVWTQWTPQNPNLRPGFEGGELRLFGSFQSGGWLLQSPPIAVPKHQLFALTVPTEPASGALEVGILGSNGNWLAPPTLMPRRVAFDTRDMNHVSIVITNSDLGFTKPLDVAVGTPILIPIAPREQYVDRLMGCRSPYLPKSPDCAN